MTTKNIKEAAERAELRRKLLSDLPDDAVVILDDFVNGEARYLDANGDEVRAS